MADTKIIAVVGATGAQGGGLVRAILENPNGFAARAITRDPNSAAAKALAAAGAEVVAGDVDDLDSMTRAFAGAYGAYCVTFFWAHFSPEKEQAEAKGLADAAKAAGLAHVIWSTLEDTRKWVPKGDNRMPTLMGKYKVPHFDAKGESDHYFTDAGVPTTFLLASFYWDNLLQSGMGLKKDADGMLQLTLPMGDAPLAGIAADDIGRCALGIFQGGPGFVGQRVGVAGEHLTGAEMAAAIASAIGQPVHYNAMTPNAYRRLGFPGAEDLGNMFQFYRDFERDVNATREVARSRVLNPALQSFDAWLAKNASRIPLS